MLFQEPAVHCTELWKKPGESCGMEKIEEIESRNNKAERKSFWKYRADLFPPKSKVCRPEKVSLCRPFRRLKKASLTVECALVLPLFLAAVTVMISFMDIYKVQTQHLVSLCQKAKETGMYAYAMGENSTSELILPDIYSFQPIGGILPLPAVWTCTTVKVHTWTGTEHGTGIGDGSESESGKMVYMTENGQVYHKKMSCSYLDLSITQVVGSSVSSRRNAYGEKYYPCESCSKGKKAAGRVYITEKGNPYHNLETCSGLKRAVRLVKESEIKGIHACSRCG